MTELEQKWMAVAEKRELVEKIAHLETTEDIQALLRDNGLEFTCEEIQDMGHQIMEIAKRVESGELKEEDLEAVAGGKWEPWMDPRFRIAYWMILAALAVASSW